jgi:subtilase family serine protease
MSSEQAGDRVFANVDQALAEKIISRSKQNNKSAEPVVDSAAYVDDIPRSHYGLMCIIKIAAAIVTLVVLAVLILRRRDK